MLYYLWQSDNVSKVHGPFKTVMEGVARVYSSTLALKPGTKLYLFMFDPDTLKFYYTGRRLKINAERVVEWL